MQLQQGLQLSAGISNNSKLCINYFNMQYVSQVCTYTRETVQLVYLDWIKNSTVDNNANSYTAMFGKYGVVILEST